MIPGAALLPARSAARKQVNPSRCGFMKRKKRNVKIIFPSLITSFSMICGFAAILLASDGRIITASYLILVAAFLDGLDGKVARLTNTASEFGIQYDSMADLVSFGVAPVVIYYRFFLYQRGTEQMFVLLPIMFLLSGAIRLARFNVTASIYGKDYFTGMPIPTAAVTLSLWPPLSDWVLRHQDWAGTSLHRFFEFENLMPFSIGLIVILSLSMVSTLKFDTFETFWFKKFPYKPLNYIVFLVFLLPLLIHFIVFMTFLSIYYLSMMYGRAIHEQITRSDKRTEIHASEKDED